MSPKIKDLIKDNEVFFEYIRKGYLYYTISNTDHTYIFPVPIDDIGDATFHHKEKAIMLMRYIRQAQEDGSFVEFHG